MKLKNALPTKCFKCCDISLSADHITCFHLYSITHADLMGSSKVDGMGSLTPILSFPLDSSYYHQSTHTIRGDQQVSPRKEEETHSGQTDWTLNSVKQTCLYQKSKPKRLPKDQWTYAIYIKGNKNQYCEVFQTVRFSELYDYQKYA